MMRSGDASVPDDGSVQREEMDSELSLMNPPRDVSEPDPLALEPLYEPSEAPASTSTYRDRTGRLLLAGRGDDVRLESPAKAAAERFDGGRTACVKLSSKGALLDALGALWCDSGSSTEISDKMPSQIFSSQSGAVTNVS